jgi:tetratricopeptide (TPR) repeat protein
MKSAPHLRPAPDAAAPALRLVESPSPLLPAEEAVGVAEDALERNDFAGAVAVLAEARPVLGLDAPDELLVRALRAESWSRMELGELDQALALVQRLRAVVERPSFTDVDRADALFRLGCCRVQVARTSSAVELYTHALGLCDRTALSSDRLRALIYAWRSRCYRRQRDLDAARADVERALELAEGLGDRRIIAHVYLEAALVAERTKQWLLARFYAEQAKELYEGFGDRPNVARLLTTLGAIDHLLGEDEEAVASLTRSFDVALDAGREREAAEAVSALGRVQLAVGDHAAAERSARQATELLEVLPDCREELGAALLVLGRAFLGQDRLEEAEEAFAFAERTLVALDSAGDSAAAWLAQGDLARARGLAEDAAERYRMAALALHDSRS